MKYTCTRKLRKWGDSLVAGLNKRLLERKGMKKGDTVNVEVSLYDEKNVVINRAMEQVKKDTGSDTVEIVYKKQGEDDDGDEDEKEKK